MSNICPIVIPDMFHICQGIKGGQVGQRVRGLLKDSPSESYGQGGFQKYIKLGWLEWSIRNNSFKTNCSLHIGGGQGGQGLV